MSQLDDLYHRGVPTAQNALDIFEGEWASSFPGSLGRELRAGSAHHFEDPRVHWACERLADFGVSIAGGRILELGALEGGHSYMLHQAGAREVIAVEANRRAFLRCLVAKEILGFDRVKFLHGDAIAYLVQMNERFDIGFASGLLYHLTNPVELIELLSRRCRSVFLWSMYYDDEYNRQHRDRAGGAGATFTFTQGGFSHMLHRHDYGNQVDWRSFRGGVAPHAHWMERAEILAALRYFGFVRQVTLDETIAWGRAISVVAAKPS
jgi:SAM-dependent methyltransferase